MLTQQIFKEKVSQRTQAGSGHPLAAEIFRSFDLRLYQHLGLHAWNGMSDIYKVGAAEIGEHHGRQSNRRSENAPAEQRRRSLPRTAQQNQLNIETMFLVDLSFLGDPRNPISAGERSHAPVDFLERFVLGETLRMQNKHIDEECNRRMSRQSSHRDCLLGGIL